LKTKKKYKLIKRGNFDNMREISIEQWDRMMEILDSSPDYTLATNCWDSGWCGGIRRYEYLSPELLEKLVEEGYADPEECQNDSPTIQEWLDFIKENPTLSNKISFHGYIVHKDRTDRRISIEGIQSSPILESVMNDVKFTEKEIEAINFFCHYADELSITENKLWVWYD
jgi:hypothetical protein